MKRFGGDDERKQGLPKEVMNWWRKTESGRSSFENALLHEKFAELWEIAGFDALNDNIPDFGRKSEMRPGFVFIGHGLDKNRIPSKSRKILFVNIPSEHLKKTLYDSSLEARSRWKGI